MKTLIITFPETSITDFDTLEKLVIEGYNKTGNKFWITLQGSKGYLDHIEIFAEGKQTHSRNIYRLHFQPQMLNNVSVWYDSSNGVEIIVERANNFS